MSHTSDNSIRNNESAGGAAWWHTGVIYQVYPRSFADSNGDGVGDIRGITSRLDYLESIGIDAVWLSPFFPSPMKDFGYDVSDYRDVDSIFGTLGDFDEMLEEAHRRCIRVVIDLVPNHTSDEHEWFVESRSSRDNPKRDWYVWRDAKPDGTPDGTTEGSPPNNWESIHGGGSAWEWDGATGQYYLHTFQKEQPDLDWSNPEIREEIYDVMRFWLDRGVDGFRIDALPCVAKNPELLDNPENPGWKAGMPLGMRQSRINSEDGEQIAGIIHEMRSITDGYDGDRVLIGEAYLPLERLVKYYGENLDGLHMPYNFGLLEVSGWTPDAVKRIVNRYETALPEGAGANWVLGNHDNPRVASRIGAEQNRVAQMLLLTLRGTPTCYYGDEIGMSDVEIPHEATQDPQGFQDPQYNRDPARTPMQWDDSDGAGFSQARPWLPIPESSRTSVAAQSEEPGSMLSLFRRLTRLRRKLPALHRGDFTMLETANENLLAYARDSGDERVVVVLNFGGDTESADLSGVAAEGEVVCSTMMDLSGKVHPASITLRPNEGLMLLVNHA